MMIKAIMAGIAGTFLMTLFLYALDLVLDKKRLKVVKVLGTMITGNTTAQKGLSDKPVAIITGMAAHYAVGVGFSLIYLWLMHLKITDLSFFHGALYGLMAGIFGVVIWRLFIAAHPDPPILPLNLFCTAIFCGHILFGLGMVVTYRILI